MVLCAPLALAASDAGPTTYLLVTKAKTASDMNTAIYRDGSRETVKLSRANGWHSQMWFDFSKHKEWATDSNAPGKCSVIAYTSDGPSTWLDPIAMAVQTAAQIPADVPSAGTAKLGNLETRIIQDPVSGVTIWLDTTHHMVIKEQMTAPGESQPKTMLDLASVRFDKPDPALFTPPSNCTQLTGSANANGGHAEETIHN